MNNIKFRQAIYDRKGKFLKFHYWGFIDGAFIGPGIGMCSTEDARKNSDQFTGLKDLNLIEAYNKDIIEVGPTLFIPGKNINSRYMVDFEMCDTGAVPVIGNTGTCEPYPFRNLSDFTIIGNIHRHPHLITQ